MKNYSKNIEGQAISLEELKAVLTPLNQISTGNESAGNELVSIARELWGETVGPFAPSTFDYAKNHFGVHSPQGLMYQTDVLIDAFMAAPLAKHLLFNALNYLRLFIQHWGSPEVQAEVVKWETSSEAKKDRDRFQKEWADYLKEGKTAGYFAELENHISAVCPEFGEILAGKGAK